MNHRGPMTLSLHDGAFLSRRDESAVAAV